VTVELQLDPDQKPGDLSSEVISAPGQDIQELVLSSAETVIRRVVLPFTVDPAAAKAKLKKLADSYILRITAPEAARAREAEQPELLHVPRSLTESVQNLQDVPRAARTGQQNREASEREQCGHGAGSSATEVSNPSQPTSATTPSPASTTVAAEAAAAAAALIGGMTLCPASMGHEEAHVQEAASIDAAGLCDQLIANAWIGAKKTPAEQKQKVRQHYFL
jgi:hypothetical protein